MNRLSMFLDEVDPTPLLLKVCGEPVNTTIEKDNVKLYKSPYGVSFFNSRGIMWFYYYDDDITTDNRLKMGAMGSNDVIKALEILEKEPKKLREKPESIKTLEKLTGDEAHIKLNSFGSWHLSGNGYSLFNNPFCMTLGYTDSADNFEIWFMDKENEPREYQSLQAVIDGLCKYSYIK